MNDLIINHYSKIIKAYNECTSDSIVCTECFIHVSAKTLSYKDCKLLFNKASNLKQKLTTWKTL